MLKDTLSKFFKVDSLLSNLSGYVETKVELAKIELKEQLGKGLARAVTWVLLVFFVAIFLLFTSIAAALAIGKSVGIIFGFLIIGSVYLIVSLVLWFNRDRIIRKLEHVLTPSLTEDK